MTDIGRLADRGDREVRARTLTLVEWREIADHPTHLGLYCPRCQALRLSERRLYLRRRPTGQQEFVHWPTENGTACPEARGESTTHQDMKEAYAAAGESLGLRAELEQPLGRRKVDVALYMPERTAAFGPVMCVEAQNSPIGHAEWAERDRNHQVTLNGLEPEPGGEKRVALWVFNHQPSDLVGEALVICDRGDVDSIVSGVTPFNDVEGPSLVMPTRKSGALRRLRSRPAIAGSSRRLGRVRVGRKARARCVAGGR